MRRAVWSSVARALGVIFSPSSWASFFVLVLGRSKLVQQIAHVVIARGLRGTPIESRGLVLHLFGELARGVDCQWAVEPDRTARYEAFHVLPPDQRKKITEFLAMEIKQQAAMLDLLFGHLVEHPRRVRIGAAQPIRKGAVNEVVLVLVRDGERKNFSLTQIGKAFHGIAQIARGSLNIY